MQRKPYTVGQDQPLGMAHELMRVHGVRHLPVTSNGRLVGVVSQRDLLFAEHFAGADPRVVPVSKAMRSEVYATRPSTPLDEVARVMGTRKLGSALVVEGDRVLGIFTTVDALRALEDAIGHARIPAIRSEQGRGHRNISTSRTPRRESRQ